MAAAATCCHGVGIGSSRNILNPAVVLGVNHTEHRSPGKVTRSKVVVAVSPIEPDLVAGAHLGKDLHDCSRACVHDDRMGIGGAETASDQKLVPGSKVDAVRTAS